MSFPRFISLLAPVAALLVTPLAAPARFMMPEVEKVPVDRLIANLEAQIKDKPADAKLHYALARVYSMSFALKIDQLDQDKKTALPFFGPGPNGNLPPKEVTATSDAAKLKAAQDRLKAAIAEYTKATALDSTDFHAQLGLAWCLDQSGDKTKAKDAYRKALELAWAKEKDAKGIFTTSLTAETIGYLLPLLDKEKDAVEIAKLKEEQAVVDKLPRAMTPILIPVGDAVALDALVAPKAAISFDLDGTGKARAWGWVTPNAGWLVHDGDGRGKITSGIQLVGAITFWIQWDNGYQALAALDDDRNGWLEGKELAGLAIWRDANSNGISEPGEVRSLAQWGITGLATNAKQHSSGIAYSPHGVRLENGTTRPSYDWIAPGM